MTGIVMLGREEPSIRAKSEDWISEEKKIGAFKAGNDKVGCGRENSVRDGRT